MTNPSAVTPIDSGQRNPSGESHGVGALLRTWRARRRMSQLDLASAAEVSTRHLSYVETGRSRPSRELLLHLALHLDVPLREQNDLLLAAGYAPGFREFDLADPEMQPVVTALTTILEANEPHPTLVMDRYWNLVLANASALAFTAGVAEHLLGPPLNVLRLSLHPDGLAPYVADFDAMASHLIHRVQRQASVSGDPALLDLLAEAQSLAPTAASVVSRSSASSDSGSAGTAALPVTIHRDGRSTSYLSVVSTFGTALDVTTSELIIETFYDVTAATSHDR